jgi:glycine cleavage system H protein
MSQKEEENKLESKAGQARITRREFIKNTGAVISGATLASLAVSPGCSSEASPTPGTNTATAPLTSSTTSKTTPTTTTGNVTTAKAIYYVPPTSNPPLEDTVGCTSKVARDRMYSIEHTWVLPLENNLAVLGITDKFQLLVGLVERGELYIMPVGTKLERGGFLANLQGQKMNVDVISPVSGTIVQVNDELYVNSGFLSTEPYLRGYLAVVELSHPAELNDLIDPVTYARLQAKTS